MKRFGKHFWVNFYGYNGRVLDSEPFDTISAARERIETFVGLTNAYGKGTYKKVEGFDKWVDEKGRVIVIQDKGDWEQFFRSEFNMLMCEFCELDNISEVARDMMMKDAFRHLDGEVDGLNDYVADLVRSGRYNCYASLAKNRMS